MTQLTIVALPAEDDYVNQISSEKVAHMTVLFLGDVPDDQIAGIFEYMQHTADMSLRRFGLSVDRRGTLGPDDADVVFFEKEGWNIDLISQARTLLLKNDNIKTAFDSTTQYPEWIPHLTLGYPASPAKKDDRDYPGIHWVNFDRLALWTSDFDGGEVPLKTDDRLSVAMSEPYESVSSMTADAISKVGAFVEHHGVKGMKWGVRKRVSSSSGGSSSTKAAPKKTSSGDATPKAKNKTGRITKVEVKKTTAEPAHKISDEELARIVKRIDLERKYATLTAVPPSKKQAAVQFVADLALDVIKTEGKKIALDQGAKASAKLVAKVAAKQALKAATK